MLLLTPAAQAGVTLADVVGQTPVYCYNFCETEVPVFAEWQQLMPDGSFTTVWADPEPASQSNWMRNGWMRNGLLCGFGSTAQSGMLVAMGYVERNASTGEIYAQRYVPIHESMFKGTMDAATYNTADDRVYGFGINPNTFGMAFESAPGAVDTDDFQVLKNLEDNWEWCPSICYNPDDNSFFAISKGQTKSTLYKYNTDGSSTAIATLDVKNESDFGALAYFPETGYLLWNPRGTSESALYAVDLNGQCTRLMALPEGHQLAFFVTGEQDNTVPASAEFVDSDFADGALSGVITYGLPTKSLSGAELSGELDWQFSVDGVQTAAGTGAPGSSVSVDVAVATSGIHTLSMKVSADGKQAPAATRKMLIGHDTPLAPLAVVFDFDDTEMYAMWESVTHGANGGYIDASKMKYQVYLNGEYQATVTEGYWSKAMTEGQPLQAYSVEVVAECNGQESEPAMSNSIVFGDPLTPDVNFAPTSADAEIFTFVADNGAVWKYNDSYDPPAFSSGNHYDGSPLDTWLILPPVKFEADRVYKLAFDVFIAAAYTPDEFYDVCIGRQPTAAAMTTTLLPTANPKVIMPEAESVEKTFTVSEPGVWYIGFHCTSASYQWGVMLRNIAVSDTGENAAVGNLKADLLTVSGMQGGIAYQLSKPATLKVMSIDGRLAASVDASGSGTVSLPAGLYIVTANGNSWKVAVK